MQYGADPSLSDNDGYTAVHLAARDGHDGVLEKLLSTGAQLFESFIYLLLPHWYFIFMMSLEGVTLPCPFCISLSRDPFQELEVSKSFHTLKALAKSQILELQSCFI